MLSRKTRSQIIDLIETVRGGLVCQNSDGRAAMLDECIAALSVSYEIMQKELSHERLAQYDDTIVTVKAAMMQLKGNPDSEEIAALSLQLIDWLRGQLKNEPVKKEIVFLPYKASMWDSLESIWKAAYEDKEHCNTYVIPIPYADLVRDEHGQLAVHSWHCEIDEMPDYVPVIDNETVNLEEMHPDVIFIHNPYDNTNYVTSVDMRYYSSELKKYTDKLIYVPYFVAGKNLPKHLAEAPGILNADYVIVESEAIKEEYERYYPGGNPPDGKFIALGSPKFDKVLSTKRADYVLPEKWKKLLKGRKAVLYNTGISAVLENRYVYLKKVRHVFGIFKNRDDVVLWWRPHPLLEATFDSIIPELADEYRKLREEYIQAGWGIYDDSPELERAIAWTDAYYGDMSSVVWLYRATGKRILIQGVEGKSYAPYWFYNLEEDKERNKFVFKAPATECLYLAETDTGKVFGECFLKETRFDDIAAWEWNHSMLKRIEDRIIIYPCMDNRWYSYELKTGELRLIHKSEAEEPLYFRGAIEYKGSLYFWNERLQLWMYSPDGEKIEKKGDWSSLVNGKVSLPFSNAGVIVNDVLYIPLYRKGFVLVIDMKKYEAHLEIIGSTENKYINLTTDGRNLWLLEDKAAIVKYDIKTQETTEYIVFDDNRADIEMYFGYIFWSQEKDNIILFPFDSMHNFDEVVVYSIGEKKIIARMKRKGGYVTVNELSGGRIVAVDRYLNMIDIYDYDGKLRNTCKFSVGMDLVKQWNKFFFGYSSRIADEVCNGGVENLIHFLGKYDAYLIHEQSAIGSNIYKWLMLEK